MLESVTQYYFIDWGAVIAMCLYIYLLAKKNVLGFVFGTIAAILWLIFGVMVNSFASVIAEVIFIILNIYGYLEWKKEKK